MLADRISNVQIFHAMGRKRELEACNNESRYRTADLIYWQIAHNYIIPCVLRTIRDEQVLQSGSTSSL